MSAEQVGPGTVVTLKVGLSDAQDVPLSAADEPLTYLHGGYGGLPEALERRLEGLRRGDRVRVQLEPEQAFGEYDAALLHVEPAARYGEGLEVGMQVEDELDGEPRLYTVTEVAGGTAVLDGNHPLAGMALRFSCEVLGVRAATDEELRRGKAG